MAMFIEKVMQISLLVVILASQQLTVNGGLVGQYFITAPKNLTVNSGTRATLPCLVGNIVGACQWTKDGFGLGTEKQLPNFHRYSMGDDDGRPGHCDLVIEPVLPIDAGVYQCQVSGSHGLPPITSKPATLNINSEPGQPHIVQAKESDFIEVEQGDEIEFQCESHGGKPAADLSWFSGTGERLISDVTQHATKIDNTDLFKTVSILKHRVTGPQEIICEAESESYAVVKRSRPLKISIAKTAIHEVKNVKEGESFTVACYDRTVSGHQPFIWLFNDIEQPMETGNILKIEEFSKDYDGSILKCLSKNHQGKTRLVKKITLKHKELDIPQVLPRISEQRNEKSLKQKPKMRGQKTVVTCIATEELDTDNEPEYVWMNGSLKKLKNNVFKTFDENNRELICKVIPNGHQKMRQMGIKMKSMSREMRKLSKLLNKVTTSVAEP